MAQRKYTRGTETPKGFECCKKKCKWQGTNSQKGLKQVSSYETQMVCPNCGNDEFYGLLEAPIEVKVLGDNN